MCVGVQGCRSVEERSTLLKKMVFEVIFLDFVNYDKFCKTLTSTIGEIAFVSFLE